ncbi:MAG TPA: C4-dicarboxylate ABC transporter substrate-binding protein [Chloroflexi bacterium]|jgi:TRAP transporter TAXI family solute receptor|nr:C4-dicarboxylate ABC transporter substrate-binding protein [Chloroflexota bacterium]HAL26256.1 C4-dicarboxylate ABC transporter substrate-binding protein [Chloroflexota bacterium]
MRGARILSVTVATLLVAAACQAPRATSSSTTAPAATSAAPDFSGKTLNIVTGGTGGVYILYGAGLADVLTKKMKVAASAQSTPASVDNMKLIRDGKADLAFTLADTAYDAINGKNRFAPPEAKVDAKTIAVMYSNYMHIVAKASGGINTVADLKGKRVSIGAAGSGTETKGIRILEAYGLNATTDIQPQRLGAQDSADALRDGKVDAFFFDGGLPTSAVSDLANSTAIKLIDQSDAIAKMNSKYGNFYFAAKIPKGTYKNDADVVTAGVANLLVVPSSFDAAFVKAILTAMFDNQADLVLVHPEAKNLKLDTATQGSPIDFHQGAIDYYKTKGVWKP